MRALQRSIGIPTDAPSTLRDKALDAVGLPNPQTPGEQIRAEAVRGGAAMLTPMGVGALAPKAAAALPAVAQPFVASASASGPMTAAQIVAGATGGAAGDVVAGSDIVPPWLKPTARIVGNILGAGATSGLATSVGSLVNAVKGVPSDIAAALDRLGIKPTTMGAVTDRPSIQQTEAVLSGSPTAGGTLQPAQRKMVDDFGNAVENTAAKLDPSSGRVVTAQDAGQIVQNRLHDWRQNTFPAEQDAVWAPLSQRLAGASVDPSGYRTALQRAATDPALDSLPAIQKSFAQAKIQEWLDALNKDVPPGQNMSWEQAMAVKRRIGDQMGTPEIVGSIGDDALKSIYGSLAGDMKTTAAANGQGGLFDAANAVTINGHQFIDGTVSKAIQKNNLNQETIRPDAAANSLLLDNAAMQQLRDRVPEAADALAAYKLRSMAAAKPSALGDTSTGTFATNLRAMGRNDPEGTRALFSDPSVAQNVRDLGTVANQFRDVERNANTSKTGIANAVLGLGGQLANAAMGGGVEGAAAVGLGSLGLPYVGGRIITNPGLIKLMAAQRGAATPMRGRVAGLLGAQATMPDDQGGPLTPR
jgi:hypothetical protein